MDRLERHERAECPERTEHEGESRPPGLPIGCDMGDEVCKWGVGCSGVHVGVGVGVVVVVVMVVVVVVG